MAAPSGISISGTLREHMGDRLAYAFEDLGEQSIKVVARPVPVFELRPKGLPVSGRR